MLGPVQTSNFTCVEPNVGIGHFTGGQLANRALSRGTKFGFGQVTCFLGGRGG